MKRIIVEGMDSTGKTTLVEKLNYEFHVLTKPIINELGPKQDFDQWWPAVLDEFHLDQVPLHDRFFYSELIYGQVLRGYVKATQTVQNVVRRHLRDSALLIYARPSTDDIEQTFGNKVQMEGVATRFLTLLKAYDVMMTEEASYYHDRFVRYNWRAGSAEVELAVERYLLEVP